MKQTSILLGLAFALAACGGEADELDAPTEASVPDLDETVPGEGAENEGGEEPTGPNEAELDADAEAMAKADAAIAANSIPAQFHGKWDATTGTCAPESDGRLEISAKEVSFYESVGDVTKVEQAGSGVKVALAMEGEGETWTDEYTFTLNEGELVTSTGTDAFARKRCS